MKSKRYAALFVMLILIVLILPYGYNTLSIPGGIRYAAASIAESVNRQDETRFMHFIDENNPEFYAEQMHLFRDLMELKVKEFKMTVGGGRALEGESYKVKVFQSFKVGDALEKLNYTAVFKRDGDTFKFSDLEFDVIDTKHFLILHSPALKKQAEDLSKTIDESYYTVLRIYGNAPPDKTVVKIYDDNRVFSMFIKPSIKFKMGGWYEYPESIKINMSSILSRVTPAQINSEMYATVIAHELTHRINGIESNNNIPYWLAEGLATFVEHGGELNLEPPARSIMELEKINLEYLTDGKDINKYYTDSYKIVSRIIHKYGMEKIHEIMMELGKNPFNENTAGQSLMQSNKLFHRAVLAVFDMNVSQLNQVLELK